MNGSISDVCGLEDTTVELHGTGYAIQSMFESLCRALIRNGFEASHLIAMVICADLESASDSDD